MTLRSSRLVLSVSVTVIGFLAGYCEGQSSYTCSIECRCMNWIGGCGQDGASGCPTYIPALTTHKDDACRTACAFWGRTYECYYKKYCTTCQAGKYEAAPCGGTTDTQCISCSSTCAAGTYETTACTSTTNRACAVCTTCAAGTYQTTACTSTTNRVCTPCATCSAWGEGLNGTNGTYETTACTSTTNRVCTPCTATCGAGTYSSASCTSTSNRVCTPCTATCGAGTYETTACTSTTNRICTPCPPGTFSTGTGANCTCTPCAPGTFSATLGASSNATCLRCYHGTYSSSNGSTSCTDCAAGTYLSVTGASSNSSCLSCPFGTTSSPGSPSCSSCQSLEWVPPGSNVCQACAVCATPGTWASSPCTTWSNTVCAPCAAGTYSTSPPSDVCPQCAAGKYSTTVGSSSNASCLLCPSGSWSSPAGSTVCTNCSLPCQVATWESAPCTNTHDCVCTVCTSGTYSSAPHSSSCTNCSTQCEAGKWESTPCTPSTNRVCSLCSPGTYSSTGLSCSDCPSGTYSSAGDSACSQCTECRAGEYEASSCKPTLDTQCRTNPNQGDTKMFVPDSTYVLTNVTNVNSTNVNNSVTYLSTSSINQFSAEQITIIAGTIAGLLFVILAMLAVCLLYRCKKIQKVSEAYHEQSKAQHMSSKPGMGYGRLSSPVASVSSKVSDEECGIRGDVTPLQGGQGSGERRYLPEDDMEGLSLTDKAQELDLVRDFNDEGGFGVLYSRSVSSAGISAMPVQHADHDALVERAERLVSELASKLADTQAAMELSRAQLGSQAEDSELKLQFERLQTEMENRMKDLEELRDKKEAAMRAQMAQHLESLSSKRVQVHKAYVSHAAEACLPGTPEAAVLSSSHRLPSAAEQNMDRVEQMARNLANKLAGTQKDLEEERRERAKAEQDFVKAHLSKVQSEFESRMQQLEQYEEERSSWDAGQELVKRAQEKITEAEGERDKMEVELMDRIALLQKERQDQDAALSATITQLEVEKEELAKRVNDEQARASAADAMKAKLAEVQSQFDGMSKRVQELESERPEAVRREQELIEKIEIAHKNKDKAEGDLRAQLAEMQKERKEQEALEQSLRARISELQREKTKLEASVKEEEMERGRILQEKAELEKSELELRAKLIELKSSKVRMEKDLGELNAEREKASRDAKERAEREASMTPPAPMDVESHRMKLIDEHEDGRIRLAQLHKQDLERQEKKLQQNLARKKLKKLT